MREIKLRVWDGNNKKFDYYPNEKSDVVELGHGIEYQQFTGLKDKNGKEIYEGDIVKYHSADGRQKEDLALVKWGYCGFCFEWLCKHTPICGNTSNIQSWRVDKWSEVIGNIYENPEIV